MNTCTIKHLAAVLALSASFAAVSPAQAAITLGSELQLGGSAAIDAAGNITVTSLLPPTIPGTILILPFGNTGSFLGFNFPNPGDLPYRARMANIPVAGPFGFDLVLVPGLTPGVGEPGPAVLPTLFRLDTWQVTSAVVGGFFEGMGTGVLSDAGGASSAIFQFSTQNFTPGFDQHSFSATIVAIPVPAGVWLLGSGLMVLAARLRRKTT
jgi:hypothetical protein